MTEHFTPLDFDRLCSLIAVEYKQNKTIFGVPEELFFQPQPDDPFLSKRFGRILETPVGVAAGPHTQLSQNIITAWLCGARFIELKTVQTLDELNVSKPCIDMENEGYNCEWSQELRLDESYREYLNAWVILHILHKEMGFENGSDELGTVFNMSVGYNLEGIQGEKVQGFLKKMKDASEDIKTLKQIASKYWPESSKVNITPCISDNITLSTMHGCPPAEIEKIAKYLVEQGYHTTIKFNPTLLGSEGVRHILNDTLGYETIVPDEAFEHDPEYSDALKIIDEVSRASKKQGVEFSFKISNTLESANHRDVFPPNEKMMYMSGKPLHVIDINLSNKMMKDTGGAHSITFSGGVDCFNIADVIACNIRPVTVCSDILKPGGYGRLASYMEEIRSDMKSMAASTMDEYVSKLALHTEEKDTLIEALRSLMINDSATSEIASMIKDLPADVFGDWLENMMENQLIKPLREAVDSACESSGKLCETVVSMHKMTTEGNNALNSIQPFSASEYLFNVLVRAAAQLNVKSYAESLMEDNYYYQSSFVESPGIKGYRKLNWFDCNFAPCTEECPVSQNVPDYMYLVANNRLDEAAQIILKDNPLPTIAGRVCDHLCQTRCVRGNYEEPLAIRDIKRYVTDNAHLHLKAKAEVDKKVAIIGAGPAGLSCAYFLAIHGAKVTIFESGSRAGGMSANAIPEFRLPAEMIEKDVERIKALGVEIRLNQPVGKSITMKTILEDGYDAVFVAVGAQSGMKLGIEGQDAEGVFDQIEFLGSLRDDNKSQFGSHIGVIGGGNSAVDVARSAWRLSNNPEVTLIYRRTVNEMPADAEEINGLIEEGIQIAELAAPKRIVVKDGRVAGLECMRMELGEPDSSGRRRPVEIPGSDFKIELDTIVSAISQGTVLDFLDGMVKVDHYGRIVADSETGKTSLENVYSGGDVVRGAATLIKAIGDGKKVAGQILDADLDHFEPIDKGLSRRELVIRKSDREFSDVTVDVPVEERRNFGEMANTMDSEMAQSEASRCLYCDQYCGICTLVCPNRANVSYSIKPFACQVPVVDIKDGKVTEKAKIEVKLNQADQIVNIGDFCNECGNCTTFCPSVDAPYKVKPKLYLTPESFDHAEDGLLLTDKGMKARLDGEIHIIEKTGHGDSSSELAVLKYIGPEISCIIDSDFGISNLENVCAGGKDISLRPVVELSAIYRGISELHFT